MTTTAPKCITPSGRHPKWSREGGLRENPGVFSAGGTAFRFRERCTKCQCVRVTYAPGPQEQQRGERKQTTYETA